MLTLLLLATAPAALAACPSPVGLTWLDEQLTAGEVAFVTDPDTLVLTSDRVVRSLPCLDEVVDERLAARLHRLNGLRFFIEDSESDAERSFASVRHASPSTGVPTTLVPAGHRVHQLFAAVDLATVPTSPLGVPETGRLLVDAAERDAWPTTIPVLVQHVDDDGTPLLTALLAPGQPLPVQTFERRERRWRPGWWAVGTGVALGAASGVLVVLGNQAYDDYQLLTTQEQEGAQGRALVDRNRALLVGGIGSGVLGATFTFGGLTWWSR